MKLKRTFGFEYSRADRGHQGVPDMANDDPHDPMMLPTPDRPRRATAPAPAAWPALLCAVAVLGLLGLSCDKVRLKRPESIARLAEHGGEAYAQGNA